MELFIFTLFTGTIFAYGQTGTGKTFTMEGVRTVPELRGIIPNSFAHVFGHIAKAQEGMRYISTWFNKSTVYNKRSLPWLSFPDLLFVLMLMILSGSFFIVIANVDKVNKVGVFFLPRWPMVQLPVKFHGHETKSYRKVMFIRGRPEMSTFFTYEITSHNFLTPSPLCLWDKSTFSMSVK